MTAIPYLPPALPAGQASRLRSQRGTFVQELARRMRNGLGSGRRVYVEYSNEVWNGIFEQHA